MSSSFLVRPHTSVSYDELFQKITVAFSDVPSPGDQIICHECDECFRLQESLCGRTPDDLSDDWVMLNFDQLPLLGDEAKQFYLPAYLRVGALDPHSLVSEFVLYSLSSDFRWEPSGGYTPQQKRVILDYLDYVEPQMDDFDRNSFMAARKLWNDAA